MTASSTLYDALFLGSEPKKKPITLDQLLQDISVFPPGTWENDEGPENWYAVADTDGIIAYFATENDACRFRLDMINRILNP